MGLTRWRGRIGYRPAPKHKLQNKVPTPFAFPAPAGRGTGRSRWVKDLNGERENDN